MNSTRSALRRREKSADQCRTQQGLAGAGRHFQQKLAAAFGVEQAGNLVHRPDLIAAQREVVLEVPEVVRANDFAFERPRRLEVLEPDAFEIFARRQPLDSVGVALVGTLEVPEPMLAAVGENDEWRLQVFGVAARLLLRVVGIEVFALCFEHAQHTAEFVFEQIVSAPGRRCAVQNGPASGSANPTR